MRIHEIKIVPPYFDDVQSGVKTFEYRKNDRDYEVGDGLFLREYNPTDHVFTGRSISVEVTYILHTLHFPEDFCILGIEKIEDGSIPLDERPSHIFNPDHQGLKVGDTFQFPPAGTLTFVTGDFYMTLNPDGSFVAFDELVNADDKERGKKLYEAMCKFMEFESR